MRSFTSKNHVQFARILMLLEYKGDLQLSFSDKTLFRNCPVFSSKEKKLEAITFILIPE